MQPNKPATIYYVVNTNQNNIDKKPETAYGFGRITVEGLTSQSNMNKARPKEKRKKETAQLILITDLLHSQSEHQISNVLYQIIMQWRLQQLFR